VTLVASGLAEEQHITFLDVSATALDPLHSSSDPRGNFRSASSSRNPRWLSPCALRDLFCPECLFEVGRVAVGLESVEDRLVACGPSRSDSPSDRALALRATSRGPSQKKLG
jgi:hypothetical protein